MKLNISYPKTVEYKSCTATIYHQKHRGKERFEVRYYDLDGSLQRLSFPNDTVALLRKNYEIKIASFNRALCTSVPMCSKPHIRAPCSVPARSFECVAVVS